MKGHRLALEEATIRQQGQPLRMPTIGVQFRPMADKAVREKQTHARYREALLAAAIEERERRVVERRLREVHLPRIKTVQELDFSQAPQVSASAMRELVQGGSIARSEPVLFLGECGTGQTHRMSGRCVAACRQRQRKRVRFTTAAGLVNELVEARPQNHLSRVLARWARWDVLAMDNMG